MIFHSLSGTWPHFLFESLAYVIGARVYWRAARRQVHPPLLDRWLLLAFAVFGAFLGSKTLHILEHLPYLAGLPFDSPQWLAGKSVLGGFLGGTLAVELAKWLTGWPHSTGDAWVSALAVGLVIGRIGCQVSGLWDLTYGVPTSLPWGWDYGDGIARHPVGLYEMLLVAFWAILLCRRAFAVPGMRFAWFMLGYCVIRLGLDFLKPPFGDGPDLLPVALYGGLTAIQWAGVAGAIYFCVLLGMRRRQANDLLLR